MRFNVPSYNPLTQKPGDAYTKASNTMSQASGSFGRMDKGSKTKTKGAPPTMGGSVLSGLAAIGAGEALASSTIPAFAGVGTALGPAGWAAIGIGAYLFS